MKIRQLLPLPVLMFENIFELYDFIFLRYLHMYHLHLQNNNTQQYLLVLFALQLFGEYTTLEITATLKLQHKSSN